MNADLLTILEYWEREKGISRDILLNAVEEALISAAKKAVGPARDEPYRRGPAQRPKQKRGVADRLTETPRADEAPYRALNFS